MQSKYAARPSDPQAIRHKIETIRTGIHKEVDVDLVKPIDMDELKLALHQGKKWKAPGIVGMS
jgi:hypothetical protein